MVSENVRKFIDMVSSKHNLDPDLVEAFVMQESSGNTNAVRVEFGFYEKYCKPMPMNDTEKMCRAMSWGLMQILGQTAREIGFNGKFLTELLDPIIGLEYGCKYLSHKIAGYAELDDAIAAYNSGTPIKKINGGYINQHYVDGIHEYYKHIKENIK
jgi:soluble lytic murein transglycosylase-like protein